MATTSVALDGVTPAGQGAEAATWLSSANAGGIALGGVIAGALIEREGTAAAFVGAAGGLSVDFVRLRRTKSTLGGLQAVASCWSSA